MIMDDLETPSLRTLELVVASNSVEIRAAEKVAAGAADELAAVLA
jgi:hypothetical protein